MGIINQKNKFISLTNHDSNHFASPRWDYRIGGAGPYYFRGKRKEGEIHYGRRTPARAHPLRRAWHEECAMEN